MELLRRLWPAGKLVSGLVGILRQSGVLGECRVLIERSVLRVIGSLLMMVLRVLNRVELIWRDRRGHRLPLLVKLHHLVVVSGVHALQVRLVAEAPPVIMPKLPIIVILARSIPFLSGALPLVDWLLLETSSSDAWVMHLWVIRLAVHIIRLFMVLFITGILCPIQIY